MPRDPGTISSKMSQNLADLKKKRGYQFASITRSSKQVTPILELSTSDVTVDHLTTVKAVLESITEKTLTLSTMKSSNRPMKMKLKLN